MYTIPIQLLLSSETCLLRVSARVFQWSQHRFLPWFSTSFGAAVSSLLGAFPRVSLMIQHVQDHDLVEDSSNSAPLQPESGGVPFVFITPSDGV